MKYTDADEPEELSKMFGGANLASKTSKSRVLIFKDADSFIKYFNKYGSGEYTSAVFQTLDKAARQVGILDILGPKYENTLKAILDATEAAIVDPMQRNKFATITRYHAEGTLEMLDGRANVPVNALGARIAGNIRSWTNLTKLGGSIFSALSDVANSASELKFQGAGGYLSNISKFMGDFARSYKGTEREAMLNAMGVFNHSMMANVFSHSGSDDFASRKITKMELAFFKANLQTPWTYKVQLAHGDALMSHLGTMAKGNFESLPKTLKSMLNSYDITAADWELIRGMKKREIDGNMYLDPSRIETVTLMHY